MRRVIRIVAGIVLDPQGRTLLVRKRNTDAFMQPGGKYGDDEPLLDALCREVLEELGCRVERSSAVHIGCFEAEAANEPQAVVRADLFACRLSGTPAPMAEIAEILWVEPDDPGSIVLAPLTKLHVLPRLAIGSNATMMSCPLSGMS
jgi:8-oxo-dGTP diphosphatase